MLWSIIQDPMSLKLQSEWVSLPWMHVAENPIQNCLCVRMLLKHMHVSLDTYTYVMYVCIHIQTHFPCKWKAQRKVSVGYDLTQRLECNTITHFFTFSGNLSLMITPLWRGEPSAASHIFSGSRLGKKKKKPPWLWSWELKSRDPLRFTAIESA